jgi:CheY-specific phosphatase CheX
MKALPPVELPKICQWLETAVVEVVETMFGSMAYADGAPDLASWSGTFLQSEISFSGGFDLQLRLWIGEQCATELTSRVLQMPKQELNEIVVGDTVGELSNMILGAVKSKMVDRGYTCALSLPCVRHGVSVGGFGGAPGKERFLHFRFGSGRLLLAVATP